MAGLDMVNSSEPEPPASTSPVAPTPNWSLLRQPLFWVLVVFALGLRLGFALVIAHPEVLRNDFRYATIDERGYHDIAATLSIVGRYAFEPRGAPTAYRTPGYVLPLAALYRILGPIPSIGVFLNVLFGAVLVASGGLAAFELLHDQRTAYTAMLLTAVSPSVVEESAYGMTDTLATLTALVAFSALAWWWRRRLAVSIVAAALWSVWSFLTRPSGGFLLPLILLWLVAQRPRREGVSSALVFTGIVGVCALPWIVRNYVVLGHFCPGATIAGYQLWTSNNPVTAGLEAPRPLPGGTPFPPGALVGSWAPWRCIPSSGQQDPNAMTEWERHAKGQRLFWQFVRQHPVAFARLLGLKLWRLMMGYPQWPSASEAKSLRKQFHEAVQYGERWLSLAGGSIGIAGLLRRRSQLAYLLLAFLGGNLLFVLVSYPSHRFFLLGTSVLLLAASSLVRDEARTSDPPDERGSPE